MRFFGEILERGSADVAHAAFEATDELVGERTERTFVGDAAFDAFGDGFSTVARVLHDGIAVGTGVHGTDGAHTAIRLEGAALIENCFAGRFLSAGEEAADHDAACAGSDGFGDIAGIFDATVGDDRNAGALCGARSFHDGGELGNSSSGDDTSGADGTRSDADLEAVNAERNEIFCAIVRGDVARDDLHFGKAMANRFDGFHDFCGVAVGSVDGEDVGFGFGHFDGAFEKITGGADGGSGKEAALLVLCCVGIFELFLDVFYGDEPFEIEVLVDDQKFFDAVLLQNFFGFFERGAHGNGDEIFFRHHGVDELRVIFFEAEVAIGENSSEAGTARNGQARDAVLGHDFESLAKSDVWRNGDGVDDHARFGPFHAVDFFALTVDGHVAVNDADAALARDGNGEAGFRDSVHGRGGEGNGEL